MTLSSSDLQSDSDLDSIRNSCDAYIEIRRDSESRNPSTQETSTSFHKEKSPDIPFSQHCSSMHTQKKQNSKHAMGLYYPASLQPMCNPSHLG